MTVPAAEAAVDAPAFADVASDEPPAVEPDVSAAGLEADTIEAEAETMDAPVETGVDDYSELEEAGAEEDVGDLAAMDGATPDDIAAAVAETPEMERAADVSDEMADETPQAPDAAQASMRLRNSRRLTNRRSCALR